jgi:peroxiredoxin
LRERDAGLAAAALGAVLALAGCGTTGTDHATKSVMDLTWGWGWDLSGSAGPYQDLSPAEREARLDYYRSRVRTRDAKGNPVKPVDQVEFIHDAKPNAPTGGAVEPAAFVDTQGNAVSLADFKGRKSVVLVFTRGFSGYICPLCTSYTAQIAYRYKDIAAAGAEVLVVFPGSPDKVQDFIRAAREILEQEGAGALPFPVLLDVNLKGVKAFGIQGDLARPSTYVIDRDGTVLYSFVGDQPHERPDVQTILTVLRRAGAKE